MTALPALSDGKRVYAGLPIRVVAGFVDGFVLWPAMIAVSLAFNDEPLAVAICAASVTFLLPLVYDVVLHAVRGATVGKSLCGLRVLRVDGGRIGWTEALRRETVFVAFGLLFLGVAVWRIAQGLPARDSGHGLGPNGAWVDQWVPWWGEYLLVAYLIWLVVDALSIVLNERSRALHDLMGGTVVVERWVAEQALPADASTVSDGLRSGGARR